jgi:hypothetical protein
VKVVRRSFLFQALAGVLSLLGLNPYATAWGLQRDLAENWGKAHLVFAALQRKEIRYCIQISDPAKFPLSSIRAQAVQALRLWMSATHEPATVTELDCVDKRFDIKFQIGPESIYPTLSSYQIIVREQGHDYSLVKINTDFRAEFRGQKFAIVDFATLVGGESRLPAVMDEVSSTRPRTFARYPANRGSRICASIFRPIRCSYMSWGILSACATLMRVRPKNNVIRP